MFWEILYQKLTIGGKYHNNHQFDEVLPVKKSGANYPLGIGRNFLIVR